MPPKKGVTQISKSSGGQIRNDFAGHAGTSMLEMASRAKISKRDLYAKFPNKRAVLLA
jgi:AcrR family transcriptional regulator